MKDLEEFNSQLKEINKAYGWSVGEFTEMLHSLRHYGISLDTSPKQND